MSTIKIILADDNEIACTGLRTLLEKHRDIEVIGEAGDGLKTIKLARELSPDLIVMDVSMPVLNGIEAARRITKESPDVKVLALSMHSDRAFVKGMLEAGAQAYLLKGIPIKELVSAIHTVFAGQTYFSPGVSPKNPGRDSLLTIPPQRKIRKKNPSITFWEVQIKEWENLKQKDNS